jgi:hypothetical protein
VNLTAAQFNRTFRSGLHLLPALRVFTQPNGFISGPFLGKNSMAQLHVLDYFHGRYVGAHSRNIIVLLIGWR